jgi:hypothetical protein
MSKLARYIISGLSYQLCARRHVIARLGMPIKGTTSHRNRDCIVSGFGDPVPKSITPLTERDAAAHRIPFKPTAAAIGAIRSIGIETMRRAAVKKAVIIPPYRLPG